MINIANILMTPEEFKQKIIECLNAHDPAVSHEDIDMLMCNLLRSIGYSDGIDIFLNSTRWYE
jgi:hypothetical protein